MKIVITCGPSFEPIDEARRITNVSSGRLGIKLANALTQTGHKIWCFKGEMSTCPIPLNVHASSLFTTNQDLADQMKSLGKTERIDAVFHVAALCDFKVARIQSMSGESMSDRKIDSEDAPMNLTLESTMKVLPRLADYFSEARIIGWKYELNGDREAAIQKAWEQLSQNETTACVLNGAAYGPGFAFCFADRTYQHLHNSDELISWIKDWLMTPCFSFSPANNISS